MCWFIGKNGNVHIITERRIIKMGEIWNSSKFQAVLASVITSAFWIILLIPAVLMDLAYYEIIHYKPFLKILGIIRIASNFGIHYTDAFSVLSQSSGMLISIIGFFLTLSIGTNERAEKKFMEYIGGIWPIISVYLHIYRFTE